MRRRRAAALTLATTAALTACLAACTTPDPVPDPAPEAAIGDTIELVDDDLVDALDDAESVALAIRMPDRSWRVPDVAVVDEVTVRGESVAVPDGAALVVLAAALNSTSDATTTFAVVSDGEPVDVTLDGPTAVVVPDGGASATIVASHDGRDVVYDPATGAVVDGVPWQQTALTTEYEDWEAVATGLPEGAELDQVAPLPLTLHMTMSTYTEDLGWAAEGSAWLTLESNGSQFFGIDVEGWPDGSGALGVSLDAIRVSADGQEVVATATAGGEPLSLVDVVEVPIGGPDDPVALGVVVQMTAEPVTQIDGTQVRPDGVEPLDDFTATIEASADVVLDWSA